MNTKEFVSLWKTEKDNLLKLYTDEEGNSEVFALIKSMNLTDEQAITMKSVINTILTDTLYNMLLGLDGCGQIGGLQEEYKLYDASGVLLSEYGDIEGEAWEQFHCDD